MKWMGRERKRKRKREGECRYNVRTVLMLKGIENWAGIRAFCKVK